MHILGENGSGKTTLLRALAGLFSSHEGQVLRSRGFLRECIYIGHGPASASAMTPEDNLSYAVRLHSGRKPDREAVWQALAEAGLAGFEDLVVRKLSAGQRKRVDLARLLLSDASLWVLDEPFSSIDTQGRELLESWLSRHRASGGAVVLTGHEPVQGSGSLTINLSDYC